MKTRKEWFFPEIIPELQIRLKGLREFVGSSIKKPKYAKPLAAIESDIKQLEEINKIVRMSGPLELDADSKIKMDKSLEPIFISELNDDAVKKIFEDMKSQAHALVKNSINLFNDEYRKFYVNDFKKICDDYYQKHLHLKSHVRIEFFKNGRHQVTVAKSSTSVSSTQITGATSSSSVIPATAATSSTSSSSSITPTTVATSSLSSVTPVTVATSSTSSVIPATQTTSFTSSSVSQNTTTPSQSKKSEVDASVIPSVQGESVSSSTVTSSLESSPTSMTTSSTTTALEENASVSSNETASSQQITSIQLEDAVSSSTVKSALTKEEEKLKSIFALTEEEKQQEQIALEKLKALERYSTMDFKNQYAARNDIINLEVKYVKETRRKINELAAKLLHASKQEGNENTMPKEVIDKTFKGMHRSLQDIEKKCKQYSRNMESKEFEILLNEIKKEKNAIESGTSVLLHAGKALHFPELIREAEQGVILKLKHILFELKPLWVDEVNTMSVELRKPKVELQTLSNMAQSLLDKKVRTLFRGKVDAVQDPEARKFLQIISHSSRFSKANAETYIATLGNMNYELRNHFKTPAEAFFGIQKKY